jgi:hypothetical protein
MLIINDEQKEHILDKISCFYNELLAKYDEKTYSEETYRSLLRAFEQPQDVTQQTLELALAWKYGKETAGALNKNPKYIPITQDLNKFWPMFVSTSPVTARSAFDLLQDNLGSHRFVTNAFLTHLMFPRDFPIVDQHNLRALRYFLNLVSIRHNIRRTTNRNGLPEIVLLAEFIEYFSVQFNVEGRTFDKYMMMFGKHVAPS